VKPKSRFTGDTLRSAEEGRNERNTQNYKEKGKMKSKMSWMLAILLIVSMLVTVIPTVIGPVPTGLTEEELAFAAAVGVGEYDYQIVETLALDFGTLPDGWWRPAGSDAEHECADWLVSEMERIGLTNVEKEAAPCHAWTFRGASVQVLSPVEKEIPASSFGGIPGTPPGGITAELVYVGFGTKQDYEGKDVEGKLVLVDVSRDEMMWLSLPHYEAELHGAVGLIIHWLGYQVIEGSLFSFDSQCRVTIPVVDVSHIDAAYLIELTNAGTVVVKMVNDATVDFEGTGYNVVGYIPGTTYPDELIIIGDHYDKWFNAATDDGDGVARLLSIAKALIDSNYKLSRTLVFVAHFGEEYGWTNTHFDWCIGAWSEINLIHPEWAGKTVAYFNCEGGGRANATSVSSGGTPGTYSFRSSLKPLFDEYFSTTAPWSSYYYPSSVGSARLIGTWNDQFPYASAGIPTMSISSSRVRPSRPSDYHTDKRSLDKMSAEALAMSTIANGIAVIRLDRSLILPYDFTYWAMDLVGSLDEEALAAAGIPTKPIYAKIEKFNGAAARAWDLITVAEELRGAKKADVVNSRLLRCAEIINSRFHTVGGDSFDWELYPHEQYQRDSMYLGNAIEALEEGDVDAALTNLLSVTFMYFASHVSYDNQKEMRERPDMFWASGRQAAYTDVYQEYFSLLEKKAAGDEDYSNELASLQTTYEVAVHNLRRSLKTITATLSKATGLLIAVKAQLK